MHNKYNCLILLIQARPDLHKEFANIFPIKNVPINYENDFKPLISIYQNNNKNSDSDSYSNSESNSSKDSESDSNGNFDSDSSGNSS